MKQAFKDFLQPRHEAGTVALQLASSFSELSSFFIFFYLASVQYKAFLCSGEVKTQPKMCRGI